MLKNKIKRLLVAALVVVSTMNFGGNLVYASVLSNEGSAIEVRAQNLKDGEYEVKNITSYLDESNTTGQGMARNSIKETSKVIVKDGIISMIVYFNEELFPMMAEFKVTSSGTDLNGIIDNETKSIKYTIPSIDSNVLMSMKIVVMGREVSFNLNNNLDTLTLIKEYETEAKVQDGDYTINNDVKYIGTGNAETGNASARRTLKAISDISVKDGKYTLTLNFEESQFKFISEVKVNVDGNETAVNMDKEAAKVSLEVPSLDSKIEVGVFVTMMNRYTNFETILLQDTLTKVTPSDDEVTVPPTDDEVIVPPTDGSNGGTTEEPGNTPDDDVVTGPSTGGSDSGNGSNGSTEEDVVITAGKLYTIKNKVTHANATGQAMARQYLNESSSLEEIDGKYYLTLTFTGMDYMSNHKFTIDGKEVSAIATKVENKTTKYRLQIPSLNATINVSTYVAPMGKNVDFEVTLLEGTKTFIKEFTEDNLPETDSSTGGSDSANDSNSGTGGSGNTTSGSDSANGSNVSAEDVVIIAGKLYTIKNKVTHANATGQAMARQYLNETSSLEEIDGKYYLTLTFSGMEYMSNHKFTIDGKEVSAIATKVDDNTTKYRFQIPSLDAIIKVSTYVAPMGRNVDFEETLLEGTKTFVKEFTIEKLPETGGVLGSNALLGIGSAMLGAAGLLKKKKK